MVCQVWTTLEGWRVHKYYKNNWLKLQMQFFLKDADDGKINYLLLHSKETTYSIGYGNYALVSVILL